MDIYSDYGNWKFENYDLIKKLVDLKSHIISRFSHVISVIDYLYNKRLESDTDLIPDEEVIFESGFNYLHDHFQTISMILKSVFLDDINAMDKISKTINLLLYTNDFQQELLNKEVDDPVSLKKLQDFEQRVLKFIEARINAPDEMFALLNDITFGIFDGNYYGVNEILYDVATDLGLVPEEDADIFDFNFIK